jgi:flagellar hook protein FlgE
MEYQALKGSETKTGTWWGKDFLLVDVDNSGPVSIDIPPGTYNGTQLAAAVQNSLREAFGDDKKVLVADGVDNSFTIDLKAPSGDGKAQGLPTPISIDLHKASIVATADESKAGLPLDQFLAHAQRRITDEMNKAIQKDSPNQADDDATTAGQLKVSGRMFKKTVGSVISSPSAMPDGFDLINITHKNPQTATGDGATRFLAYSNTNNSPEVKVFDKKLTLTSDGFTNSDGKLKFVISGEKLSATDLESIRFLQNKETDKLNSFITEVGAGDVAISSAKIVGENTEIILDHSIVDTGILAGQSAITVLAKPSDHIEAYFDNTQGLVEGVSDVFYANQLVLREIQTSAKRTTASDADNSTAAFAFAQGGIAGQNALTAFGLGAATESINWIDDRDPAIKLGYDETNQCLTFDAVNSKLGKGTGVGFDVFTVYSKKLDAGENGLGIEAFGNNSDIDLKTDEVLKGSAFVPSGAELRVENKRYGMEVEFDTVNNNFVVKSGTTGESLRANSAVGVTAAQNESSIAVGRYGLTETGARDSTDDAQYAFNKIGKGTAQILGFPRDGIEGYTKATGLVSKPAVAVGGEALMNMEQAFQVTALAGENIVNVVVNGVSASIVLPEGNYKGTTFAAELETRINNMRNPVSGAPVGGVKVTYDADANNLTFTTATSGESSTIAIDGALKFGLKNIPLGLGVTTEVRQPVQATDELGRPLYISPTGEITANNQAFADNMVQDYYPLYLDEGELTFDIDGNIVSPITQVDYEGLLKPLTMDFSKITQLDKPFSAEEIIQDGYAAGRLTNLEIDNYGNVNAGYSNGQNVALGKIIVANFANNSGLKQIGNSSFLATKASGDPELGEAANDGFGQVLSGSLERSNVDITEELVNLITSQRNYQAAAKAIETSSSMTQTIINIRS